ncbi:MAG: cupin domain-containing protein [Deltaproteobacteria bacterium]|nr:cupin domain-containing protein [Deltaproteobacteria bacterium]
MARETPERPEDRLDRAIEAIVQGDPAPETSDDLRELIGVAEALRALPREGFRAELGGALRPPIVSHDLRELAKDLPLLQSRWFAKLERASVGVFRFQGRAPWERHPDGDEMILVLDGGGEITVLTDDGPVQAELRPGRLFVCPRGLWHRPVATPSMTALYVTPIEGNEHSWADDPRVAG